MKRRYIYQVATQHIHTFRDEKNDLLLSVRERENTALLRKILVKKNEHIKSLNHLLHIQSFFYNLFVDFAAALR